VDYIVGDITQLKVDAIVNAANSSLLGGGGVDGAIHRAAGPKLLEECRMIRRTRYPNGMPSGKAVVTRGYLLPARFVIHTVGPVYHPSKDKSHLLESCYVACLKEAENLSIKSIAFPAISCGAYGYPLKEAAEIFHRVVTGEIIVQGILERIIMCLFSRETHEIFSFFSNL